MNGGVVQSSVLVGREDLLAQAAHRLAAAASGTGQLLLVSGEAGIGKTRLLDTLARVAGEFTVVRAAAFPGDMHAHAGLFLDLAGSLKEANEPVLAALGQAMAQRLRSPGAPLGDAHRRRRLLIQDLVDLILGAGVPTLIILEDLHWADQLSVETLGHLAGKLGARPILIAASFRSDELYPRLPMRELRSRLLAQRLAEEIRLPRLDLDQTATLAQAHAGRLMPTHVIAAIHERSDGIPLHIEELLAASGMRKLASPSGLAVTAEAVPETLADAVLARAARLSQRTRWVASAAAVIGRSFDFDLLAAVTGIKASNVAAALRELREVFLIIPGTDTATFDFRHALIRDTIYADTDLPARRRLHARVARTAADLHYRDAFLSAHFELAHMRHRAFAHAVAAARQAGAMSAHREALELYHRAVRNMPAHLAAADRVNLYTALGDEAAATDNNSAAADAYRTAHQLTLAAGDTLGAAALTPRMTAVAHLLGVGLDERIHILQAALASLDTTPAPDRERAQVHSAIAAAYMLSRRLDQAASFGRQALDSSRHAGDDDTALDCAATLGSVLVFAGQMAEGWQLLEEAISHAQRAHQEAQTARGFRMIGSCASVLVEYDRAETWLANGIRYAEQVEMWNHRHYMAAHLAHVQWGTGHWQQAAHTAQRSLTDGRGGATTRITAHYVLGYLAMGRCDPTMAARLLGEALAEAEQMAELQRVSPPLWALAETALQQNDFATAVTMCERGFEESAAVTDAAYLYPYLVTGARAYLAQEETVAAQSWAQRVGTILRTRAIPGTLPAIDHAHGLILLAQGNAKAAEQALRTAADAWQTRRRFWEGTWALLDLAAAAAKQRRRGIAARLAADARTQAEKAGAKAIVTAAEKFIDTLGQGKPLAPWHPLTTREFEVAQLVAAGLTNRQIAENLVLSPKTISAHIEHILAKLTAAHRSQIAAWCTTIPTRQNARARCDRPGMTSTKPQSDT